MADKKPKKRVRKKVAPKRRLTNDAVEKAIEAVDTPEETPEEKEQARRRESSIAPSALEVVHPHYSLHLHIAWDVGYKSIYMDQWKQEQTLYHIVQQSSRFVVHRRDYKTYADRDLDQSHTVCSIEFHDKAKTVPMSQLVQHGDAHKLLEELSKGLD